MLFVATFNIIFKYIYNIKFSLLIWKIKKSKNIQNLIQKMVFLKILESKQNIRDFPKNIVSSFINYGIESKILMLAFFLW
jgi:hypothetical protein